MTMPKERLRNNNLGIANPPFQNLDHAEVRAVLPVLMQVRPHSQFLDEIPTGKHHHQRPISTSTRVAQTSYTLTNRHSLQGAFSSTTLSGPKMKQASKRTMKAVALTILLGSLCAAFGENSVREHMRNAGYSDAVKIAPDLQLPVNGDQEIDVLVDYRTAPTSAHHRRVQSLGGKLRHNFEFIQAAHYGMSQRQIEQMIGDPDVVAIHPDRTVNLLAFNNQFIIRGCRS
jgi:hypothetical protein